ncbi:MAG: hypothetical protein OER21_08315 [Gemmatimonadota bacterium]|nr:hypothetical protein [Gemmatimonadota bacterium]
MPPSVSLVAVVALLVAACGPRAPETAQEVRRITDDVMPRVEEAVGLRFLTPPVVAVRTRDQVHAYLVRRLDEEYPPALMADIAVAYRLFHLVPDTLDLRALLLAVLSEQVVGYYDPDSTTLYVVDGTDPVQLRLVLAHELVHALQGQYVPLDSLLQAGEAVDPTGGENDRRMAAQAVLEGQATLASLTAMLSDEHIARLENFWRDLRENVRQEQERMPVFAAAPLVIREGLLFPYLAGADFLRWFGQTYPDTLPFGPRLPTSTEQVLHPDRYRAGDAPTTLRFRPEATVGESVYEDTWGEFEMRLVLQVRTGSESLATAGALGWDGDRFAVFADDGEHALVWWSVWDGDRAAEKFASMLERYWGGRVSPGRRWTVARATLDGRPAVRLVEARDAWVGWMRVPGVEVR